MEISTEIEADLNRQTRLQLYFEHNWTPHFRKQTMECLSELFLGLWIGSDHLQNRPTWSPDLTVLISMYGVTRKTRCMNGKETDERNYCIAERHLNDNDVRFKLHIILNFSHQYLHNLGESDPCSYAISDWE